ncbi:hypothetical protein SteCoe_35602 [Stentor coeruleus]|uniref:Uncharacterized protein n=1 Tax=Stentor coeruleus TaxID=5963 RepID=A0A1R2AS09_9CILI|nr:hypothetical protein SteCoe_35602 [Stentor coeruleus]
MENISDQNALEVSPLSKNPSKQYGSCFLIESKYRGINVSLSEDKKSYVRQNLTHNLQLLEQQIVAFQDAKFPKLRLPKTQKKWKKRTTKSVTRTHEQCIEKKVNIPSSLRPTPIPDFHLPKIDANLGPGCYSTQPKDPTPGVYISNQARFTTNIEDQLNFILHRNQSNDPSLSCIMIEKRNMELIKFLPGNRQKLEKEKIKEREIRSKIQKKAKDILEETIKKSKEEKYIEKLTKHEWRNMITELNGLSRVLFIYISSINIAFVIKCKIQNTIALHKSSKSLLSFLYYTCKFIGKLRRRVFLSRLAKLYKLTSNMFPKIRIWLDGIRVKYRNIINHCIEKPILSDHLFELMAEFNRKILKIQRAFRYYNHIRKARINALKKKFDISGRMMLRRNSTMKMNKTGNDKIPQVFIEEMIYEYYYGQVKKYLEDLKIYWEELKVAEVEYEEYLKENIIEVILHGKNLDPAPRFVPRPILKIFSDDKAWMEKVRTGMGHVKILTNMRVRNKRHTVVGYLSSKTRTPITY